jgi:hypothetical protein
MASVYAYANREAVLHPEPVGNQVANTKSDQNGGLKQVTGEWERAGGSLQVASGNYNGVGAAMPGG